LLYLGKNKCCKVHYISRHLFILAVELRLKVKNDLYNIGAVVVCGMDTRVDFILCWV